MHASKIFVDDKKNFKIPGTKIITKKRKVAKSIRERAQNMYAITLKPGYNPQIRTNFWRQYPGWIIKRVDDIKGGLG
jgi:hypothetical protein